MATPYFTYEDVQREAARKHEDIERNLFRVAVAGAVLGAGLTFGAAIAQGHEASAADDASQTWVSPTDRIAVGQDLDPSRLETFTSDVITSDEGIGTSTLLAYGGVASIVLGAAAGGTGLFLERRRDVEPA